MITVSHGSAYTVVSESAVFAVVRCPFCPYVCPSVCHVGGSYCQTSFRPDCPIICIFWSPAPVREGQKYLGNGKILWLLANQSRYIHINSVRKFSALFNNSVGKCCLHSFYYIFYLLSLQRQHPLPLSESELTIPGTEVPGNIRSRELLLPGAKVPSHWEFSLRGTKIPGR